MVHSTHSDACLLCTVNEALLWDSGRARDAPVEASASVTQQLAHPKAAADKAKAARSIPHVTSEASVMSVESDDDVNDLTGEQCLQNFLRHHNMPEQPALLHMQYLSI